MAQTYRDVAINQMIATTEEAMSHAFKPESHATPGGDHFLKS